MDPSVGKPFAGPPSSHHSKVALYFPVENQHRMLLTTQNTRAPYRMWSKFQQMQRYRSDPGFNL